MGTAKPLGYWLQHLHNLLQVHLALVLSDLGAERRDWQLLNTLAQGPRSRSELEQALAPFWVEGQPDLGRILADLAARGWVEDANGTVMLSATGAAVHAELARRVEDARTVVVDGLTPDQYQETVRVLSTMAGNVEAAVAAYATAQRT